MASVTNLRKGSTGEDVKKLQTALGFTGKDVDGIYGSKTEQAVINYQKANGLAVDGIAGKETQGSLYTPKPATSNTGGTQNANTGSNTGTGGNTFTTPAGNTYDTFTPEEVTYDPYQMSDTVSQAWATVGQLQGNAPGSWTDPYKDQYLSYLDQYKNRDPFSYDFNSDALYQQYKDQYIMQGQLASMDAMGQAAALSGGYGNSYAQTVGQQAYNQYLNQLNAMIPELYDRAYGIYQQEGQDLFNMYNAYKGLSDQEYNRYLGDVDRYYKDLAAKTEYAQNLYNREYGEWADKTGMDIDILNAKNNMGLDTWATKLGIISGENQMLMNQEFQSTEAEKDRKFQETENSKSRAAAAAKSSNTSTEYKELSTSDQQWYENKLKKCTTPEQIAAIGAEMEAKKYDPYLVDLIVNSYLEQLLGNGSNPVDTTVEGTKIPGYTTALGLGLTGGSGSGTSYWYQK